MHLFYNRSLFVLSHFVNFYSVRCPADPAGSRTLNSTQSYPIAAQIKSDRSHVFRIKTMTAVIPLLVFVFVCYLTLISNSLPFATETRAVFPGSGSLLIPYWYSHVIEASESGYFASLIVTPSASPVMFKSEKYA